MTTNEKLQKAMNLLNRAAEHCGDNPPDDTWFRDLFILTGEHMILSDECWEPGSLKRDMIEEYGDDAVRDEVNAPKVG